MALIIFCSQLFSCSQKPAKIIDKSHAKYGKLSRENHQKYQNFSSKNQKKSAKNSSKSTKNDLDYSKNSGDEVVVGEGETIYGIAKKNAVSVRELIEINNLKAPYAIKAKDILKIPQDRFHEVKEGETIYSVSRFEEMKVDELIQINNLRFPYVIHPGERLKVHGISQNQSKESIQISDSPKAEAEKSNKIQNPSQKNIAKSQLEPNFFDRTIDKNSHFSWPIYGKIISKFGPKSGGLYNDGINIQAKAGAEVHSSQGGIIAYVGNELKGYGNLIIIKHPDGWLTAYAHLKSTLVKKGEKVKKGQKIGLVGSTGKVAFPQLYFGLRKGNDAVNPENYLHKI